MIHRIVQFALRQRALILLLVAIVVIAGVISFERMPVDAYPDLSPRWWRSLPSGLVTQPKRSNAWSPSPPKLR